MGLFGGLFKIAKKVVGTGAKMVASKLTGGASDIVLKKLKGTGQLKATTAKTGMPTTEQERALVNKAFPDQLNPSIKQTEYIIDEAGQRAGVIAKRRGATGKARRTMKPRYSDQHLEEAYAAGWRPAPAKKAPKKKAPKKTKGTGKTTSQAQKMKALAAEWRAAGGQQGTGQTFFAWKAGR